MPRRYLLPFLLAAVVVALAGPVHAADPIKVYVTMQKRAPVVASLTIEEADTVVSGVGTKTTLVARVGDVARGEDLVESGKRIVIEFSNPREMPGSPAAVPVPAPGSVVTAFLKPEGEDSALKFLPAAGRYTFQPLLSNPGR